MAPTRPTNNSKQVRPHLDASSRGIQKRKKTLREDGRLGRGRKNTWSLPWLKRMVVLRTCGLQFNEIFEVLSILSGGSTPKVSV